MARFEIDRVDAIMADFEQLAQLNDDDKYSILEHGSDVLIGVWRDVLGRLDLVRSGQLRDSIKAKRKKGDNGACLLISPTGNRSGAAAGKRKPRNPGKPQSNATVGYVLEYGSPRIKARHWMETANEEADDDLNAALSTGWDEYLKSKGF